MSSRLTLAAALGLSMLCSGIAFAQTDTGNSGVTAGNTGVRSTTGPSATANDVKTGSNGSITGTSATPVAGENHAQGAVQSSGTNGMAANAGSSSTGTP